MRVVDKKQEIRRLLEEHQIEEAALEASIFIENVTGLDKGKQILYSTKELTKDEERAIDNLTKKRCEHIPTAYLLGRKEFFGRSFKVTPAVLIPRPDTETLVECCINYLEGRKNAKVLDLCTGSGCVGISIAAETKAEVTLSDISPEALEIAKENTKALLEGKATLMLSDLFERIDGKFDVIATNPPYLEDAWWDEVTEEVRKEPEKAFLGFGPDGLSLIRKIIKEAPTHLEEDGLLALECDFRQTEECAILMKTAGFKEILILKDLGGLERVVRGVWHA